jgi:uncharacterized repeat protein (TIGR01451 family)
LFLAASLLLISFQPSTVLGRSTAPDAPQSVRRHEKAVPGSYIVVLKDEATGRVRALADQLSRAHGGRLVATYERALRGFSVQMNEAAAEALAHNPLVDYVEEDAVVEAASVTQTSAPWGLDRIDQTSLPLSTTYTYTATGAGVHAYIIDSGIRTTHTEFGTRASVSFDNVGDGQNGQDCFGHGTQLAGIVGGSTYGVAKGVQLHAVRVFSCGNTTSLTKVIGGIDWVTANHQSPSVALLSFAVLGSSPSASSLDTAVNSLITSGVTTVIPAGNNNLDAGTRSPARVAAAITVGSVDQFDTRGVVSNFGASLDLFAPGVDIPTAEWFSDTATTTSTGTSMAAAHAAGVAAMYLETHPFFASPADVSQALVNRATTGVVINPGAGSPNRLLHLTEQSQVSNSITATKVDAWDDSATPDGKAEPGQTVTYSVTISNTGAWDATNVVFTDTVDPNTTLLPGAFSGGGPGGTVAINVGTLPPGSSATITFQVTIDNPYMGGSNVSNQGTVTADGGVNVLTDDPAVNGASNPTLTPIHSNSIQVNDARQAEPPSGTSQMLFVLTLSDPAPSGGLNVNYATASGGGNPATGGASCDGVSDYVNASGTLAVTAGSRTGMIPITVCADSNSSETDETLLLNISSPSSGTIADSQATGTITTSNPPGVFSISELRTRGTAGAGDDFVELYNNTTSPLTVSDGTGINDASHGYGVFKMGSDCNATPVLVGVVPNGTVIPARGHYLLRGSAYSLSNYGGTNAAAGDLTMASDIEDDANVAVFSTANVVNISSVNRLDAVGFGSHAGAVCDLMREGSNLAPVGALNIEYSYARKECDLVGGVCNAAGNPKDTNDNSADFMFADTAMTSISGIQQRLGAPGPENLASPIRRDDSGVILPLLDATKSSSAAPNRERFFTPLDPVTSPQGTLVVRRRVQNTTASTLTKLRFRIIELTTGPTPPVGTADLRMITSTAVTISNVTDAATCASTGTPTTTPCTVTAQGVTLETPPNQPQGGGYNSTVSLSIPGGLAPNASMDVNFVLGVVQGGTFRFLVIIEALP